ncbi:MAG: deoxyguanosinetriphosphate triphosphohydrolase [Deltaproteobacteria bacterium]
METTRTRVEKNEKTILASYASRAEESRGRLLHGDENDDYRTCFQRDRDRILYTKSFKDLQYKTQVFLINEGDFYRTRLTHTLEVAQHARTLARALELNEDLCEAIAYAHDLGHPPFGHAGESALNEIMKCDGGFEHNIQSLRVVDELEKRYKNYNGLNLTFETREGIARHHSIYDNPLTPVEFLSDVSPSLETQVVNIADPLAYCAHDLEDALNAGLISFKNIVEMDNDFVQAILESCVRKYKDFNDNDTLLKSRLLVREIIEETNLLVIKQTKENITKHKIRSLQDARKITSAVVCLPDRQWDDFCRLKTYLMENVYQTPQVCIMNEKGRRIINKIFEQLEKTPRMLPLFWKSFFDAPENTNQKKRIIADYVSSMTDQYAMLLYRMMFEPNEKIMFSFRE